MKKVLFLTCIPTPHWLRFVPFLRKHMDARFYYYDTGDHGRPDWWVEDLGAYSFVLPKSVRISNFYFNWRVWTMLNKERPDVLLMGGFVDPGNILAYIWARLHGCKTGILTERSRTKTGKLQGYNLKWRFLRFFYRKLDRIVLVASGGGVEDQFRKTLKFGDKVVQAAYPAILDVYYKHPVRQAKEAYTIIHANGLVERYNPLCSVKAFAIVHRRYPKTRMKMNALGALRCEVEKLILENGLTDSVEFLEGIKGFDDLDRIYAACDIMILPALRSNGNYTINECGASGMGLVVSECIPSAQVERIKRTGAGFVVPPTPEAFADKICWYIEHPEEFARVAELNRKGLAGYTMEAKAETYAEIVNNLFS